MNDDYFFSVNRLVEFGLSLAVAHQMINTMNSALTDMKVPGTFPNFQTQNKSFFVIVDDIQLGPMDENALTSLIIEGKVSNDSFVWFPGLPAWTFAGKVNDVAKLFLLVPPAKPKI